MKINENNSYDDQAPKTYEYLLQEVSEIKNNYSIEAADYVLNTFLLDGTISKGVQSQLKDDIRSNKNTTKFKDDEPIENLITKDDILTRIKNSDWGAFLKENMDLDNIEDEDVDFANKFADRLIGALKLEIEDEDEDEGNYYQQEEDFSNSITPQPRIFVQLDEEVDESENMSDEDYFGIPGIDY